MIYLWQTNVNGCLSIIIQFYSAYSIIVRYNIYLENWCETIKQQFDILIFGLRNFQCVLGRIIYDFQVPFGVVNLEGHNIKSIVEKPIHKFFVSAGIYMLDPACIDFIPKDEFYDMPTLFDQLIKKDEATISFPLSEYWLDIGRIEEYEKANNEYHGVFS